jgi:hypothetical protein
MPKPPRLDIRTNINHSPHIVLLGAGASFAACKNGDANGRTLPLMNNLLDTVGLNELLAKHGLECTNENFEVFYSQLARENKHPELISKIEGAIEQYFLDMELPETNATIYDYLVLSLRSKDIIATFNWDPFLAQAFNRNKEVIGFEYLPQIVHLHGNVSAGICYECKRHGWRYNICDNCHKQFEPSKLLYPVDQKNYNVDPFIRSEWEELKIYIKEAYFFTIFGYSAPTTDIEAKNLLLEAWEVNEHRTLSLIEIIDIKASVKKNWEDFTPRKNCLDSGVKNDFFNSHLAIYPRRNCEALAMATLQQSPWRENRFLKTDNLHELQEWIKPLLEEEKQGNLTGTPCN